MFEQAKEAQDYEIYVDDRNRLSVRDMAITSRKHKTLHGLDLIIIDYLGLVKPSRTGRGVTREQEVTSVTHDIVALAKDLGVPVVLMSQMNRDIAKRRGKEKKPQLSDLRDSSAIEQDSDVVIFPWRPMWLLDTTTKEKELKDIGINEPAEIIVAKNRNGAIGTIPAWWNGIQMQFREREQDYDLDEYMSKYEKESEEDKENNNGPRTSKPDFDDKPPF
jgi:replicative DNA helicase